jgi:VanZ family protein
MRNPWIYRAPAIGWGFFILYACLLPASDLHSPYDIKINDKLIHFVLYFSWIILLYFATSRAYQRINKRKVLIYWVAAIAIGGCIELMQNWMALGRSGDSLDALANTAGALTGMVCSRVIHRVLA